MATSAAKGTIKHREFAMASGEMNADEFSHFLTQTFGLLGTYTAPGALMYACMDWRHMTEILTAIHATGCDLLNLCIWVKNNGGMGSLYRSRHESHFCDCCKEPMARGCARVSLS
jgi:hypothetical protein